MRVLVVGEGSTEIGAEPREQEESVSTGFLRGILPRLLNARPADEFIGANIKDPRLRVHVTKGKSQKFSKLVAAAARMAQRDGFDRVVVVVDRDCKHRERRLQALQKGRDAVAQDYRVHVAVGVAIEEIEAWILADEQAIARALGGADVPQQKNPEKEKDPKGTLNALVQEYGTGESQHRDFVAEVAEQARIEVLERRCKKGFGKFAADVRQHLDPLAGRRRRR